VVGTCQSPSRILQILLSENIEMSRQWAMISQSLRRAPFSYVVLFKVSVSVCVAVRIKVNPSHFSGDRSFFWLEEFVDETAGSREGYIR